jgi:two-component system, cell cycle response regulator
MVELESERDRRSRDRVGAATILIVDDSKAIRRILRRALEDGGHTVREAADGLEALAACRAELPDLVLLDMDMPVMDGPAALKALRADDALAHVPVLFLTARTTAAEVAAGLELGAEDYLRKPCQPAELTARVGAALRQKVERDSLRRQAVESDRLSSVDVLTGVANRRGFELRRHELLASGGPDTRLCLIMIDVDHFKSVNDTHGHSVGDLVLRILAVRLRRTVPAEHTLVRWGGEEFVVLAPGVDDAGAAHLSNALRAVVCATPLAVGPGLRLDITVSVGWASGRLDEFELTVATADAALYDAKHAGRNRVATRAI